MKYVDQYNINNLEDLAKVLTILMQSRIGFECKPGVGESWILIVESLYKQGLLKELTKIGLAPTKVD